MGKKKICVIKTIRYCNLFDVEIQIFDDKFSQTRNTQVKIKRLQLTAVSVHPKFSNLYNYSIIFHFPKYVRYKTVFVFKTIMLIFVMFNLSLLITIIFQLNNTQKILCLFFKKNISIWFSILFRRFLKMFSSVEVFLCYCI
jgi:hypothetical protein